jgi:hypothetical protein
MKRESDDLAAADLLQGGEAIAAFTGLQRSQVFYLCNSGALPAFKIGMKWCALKSELRAALRSKSKPSRRRGSAPDAAEAAGPGAA